jgi:hypothetical protein
MDEKRTIVACQDTGNPVLDSLVNLRIGMPGDWPDGGLERMHALLLKLAALEPGGLRRHGEPRA